MTDHQYVQRVRAYPPSGLLPLIAQAGALAATPPQRPHIPDPWWQEWVLADIARVSLAHGNEYRSARPTLDKLVRLHATFLLDGDPKIADTALEIHLLRLFNQQLDGQADPYLAQARSAAILLDTTTDKPLEVLSAPGWEQDLLGCRLVQYVAATRLIMGCALFHQGCVDPDVLIGPNADPQLLTEIDYATLKEVIKRHFAIDTATFKAADQAARDRAKPGHPRRYTFNPLRDKPLISGYGPGYLCPSRHLVWSKSTPLGLFFTGRHHYGDLSFARDVGHLFEAYVGRNLQLLPDTLLHAEIIHRHGRKGSEQLKSVDWIVEFPDLLLLLEVKATMPTEAVRMGDLEQAQNAWAKVGKAAQQVEAVATYIRDGHPAYAHITPSGRPIIGLVVTLEPFYLLNGYQHLPATTTPIYVASAEELERLVTVTSAPASQLVLDFHRGPADQWHLREIFKDHQFGWNPIIEQAWKHYPWSP